MNPQDALTGAVQVATKSPCCKSKRGVVVWGGRDGIRSGFNGPPPGFACDGSDACREACNKVCVHAEHRALMNGGKGQTDLLHVKVVDGRPVVSGPPSCWQCSRAILDAGIQRVWLLEEGGLCAYSAEDFHVLTLKANGLPVIRDTGETP